MCTQRIILTIFFYKLGILLHVYCVDLVFSHVQAKIMHNLRHSLLYNLAQVLVQFKKLTMTFPVR